jgi:cytidine deaminase
LNPTPHFQLQWTGRYGKLPAGEAYVVTDTSQIDEQSLIEAASKVRLNAHAPYSKYSVGAALLDENGQVHCGCNVENAAFGLGICAEASAICHMVAAGGKEIVALAVVGGADEIEPCTPCGGCRQNIREFAAEDARIILIGNECQTVTYSIEDLLPVSFSFTSTS